jgi:hypothetical protein
MNKKIIATIQTILIITILQNSNPTVQHTVTVIVAMLLIYAAGRKN